MSPSAPRLFKTCLGRVPFKLNISIELDRAHENGNQPFSTGDEITGTVLLTSTQKIPIENIEVVLEFEGRAQTTVRQSTPRGQTGLQHTLLKIFPSRKEIKQTAPQSRENEVSSQLPFHLEVPNELPHGTCGEFISSHVFLPPSFNDTLPEDSGAMVDKALLRAGQITYRLKASLLRQSSNLSVEVLATAAKPIRILSSPPETYIMSLNNNGPKGQQAPIFAQQEISQGRLDISAVPPNPIRLPGHGDIWSGRGITSAGFVLKMAFHPRHSDCLPPRIGTLRLKLVSSTSFKASPTKPEFHTPVASRVSCKGEEYRKIHVHSFLLSGMQVGGKEWVTYGSEVGFNGSEESLLRPGGLKYSLDIPVSFEVSRSLLSAPSFASCLISRSYALDVSLIYYPGGGLFSRTISLRIPLNFYI